MLTKRANKYLPNTCPLVQLKVPHKTCLRCCFKGDTIYQNEVSTRDTCDRGCCTETLYETAYVDCKFILEEE